VGKEFVTGSTGLLKQMNQDFIAILQQLVSEQGKEALLNPAKCKAFLADYTKGEHKKESRLLLQALDAGVPKAIDAAKELENCKQQQVRVLHEEHFLTAEAAVDVVDALALVLREGQEKETSKSTVCSNCGKELQKEWEGCPYCLTPVAKTQQSLQQAKPQPIPSPATVVKDPAPAAPLPSPTPVTQTASPLPTMPPKKKNTARNVIITGIVILVGGIIIYNLNSGPSYSGSTADPVYVSASDLVSANEAYDIGLSYYNARDYNKAITQFTEAIRLNPNNFRAYAYRGQAYRQRGEKNLAIKDLEKALSLNPSYKWASQRLKEIRGY
jgi:tetratricopeptide (TPR) repeat protein